MSQAFDLVGVTGALQKAAEVVDSPFSAWQPYMQASVENARAQTELLRRAAETELDLSKIPELTAIASLDPDTINQVLAEHNFDLRVQWPQDGATFGVLAILDILVQWLAKGNPTKILAFPERPDGTIDTTEKAVFEAFTLDADNNNITCLEVPGSEHPLIRIPTENMDTLCIHPLGSVDLGQFDLYDTVERLKRTARPNSSQYGQVETVTIPMVHLITSPDISWLRGMYIGGFNIAEAMQEVRFGMNEHGARFKAATTITMRAISVYTGVVNVIVDESFVMWIERGNVPTPLCVLYVTPSDWRNPKDLKDL